MQSAAKAFLESAPMCDVISFLHLGRPNTRPPRGFSRLLKQAHISQGWVRRTIKDQELFDKGVSIQDGSELGDRYNEWLQELSRWLDLPWSDTLMAMPTYLQFRNVTSHTDGQLQPFDDSEYFFANFQLAGRGRLTIAAPDTPPQTYHISAGDMYLFDQRLEHGWQTDSTGLAKVFSVALPAWAVHRLQLQRNLS